ASPRAPSGQARPHTAGRSEDRTFLVRVWDPKLARIVIDFGALAVGLVACTTTQPPPAAKPEPVATNVVGSSTAGSPSPAPKIDTSSWAKDWPKTWADPRVVDALAQKCDFVPDG